MSQPKQKPYWKLHIPEYATEFSVVLVSIGLFAFVKLANVVTDGATRGFDEYILLLFRDPTSLELVGPAWLEGVGRDVSALGGFLILGLLSLAVCGYLLLKRKNMLALYIAVAVSSGSLLNTILKGLIERPRPDIVPHATSAALSSFPSGHAMMSAVVFLTLGALLALSSDDKRIKIYILFWSVFMTVLVGISRVYLGVHWPTDIIAGWIAGSIWAILCLLVSQKVLLLSSK